MSDWTEQDWTEHGWEKQITDHQAKEDKTTKTVTAAAYFEARRGWCEEFRNPTEEDGP